MKKDSPWCGSKWARLEEGTCRPLFWLTLLAPYDDNHWTAITQNFGDEEFTLAYRFLFPVPGVTYHRID